MLTEYRILFDHVNNVRKYKIKTHWMFASVYLIGKDMLIEHRILFDHVNNI